MTIDAALNKHVAQIMSTPGVFGVGIGKCQNEDCIRIYINKYISWIVLKLIPQSIEGYKVEAVEISQPVAY